MPDVPSLIQGGNCNSHVGVGLWVTCPSSFLAAQRSSQQPSSILRNRQKGAETAFPDPQTLRHFGPPRSAGPGGQIFQVLLAAWRVGAEAKARLSRA